jgi:all-trans-retinol dehydrogenase (NAD+)
LLAEKLVSEKVTTIICDLNQDTIDKTVNEIKEKYSNGKIFGYVLDVTDYKKVYEVADKIKKDIGNVTMLFNNAGIVTGKKFMDSRFFLFNNYFFSENEMLRIMNVNVISNFWTLKAFLPNMIEKNHGHIITVSSAAGISGTAGLVGKKNII